MKDPFLPSEVVKRITDRTRFAAQCRMLDKMKIPYIPSSKGEPLVSCNVVPGYSPIEETSQKPNYSIFRQ